MEIVCCYCKKHIRYVEPMDDKRVSHGMCHVCEREQDKILAELIEKEKRIKKYLLGGDAKQKSPE